MTHTKREGQKAFKYLMQWRELGVPDLITKFEAYQLTDGLVGVPYSHAKQFYGMRLVDVAIEYAKKTTKKTKLEKEGK